VFRVRGAHAHRSPVHLSVTAHERAAAPRHTTHNRTEPEKSRHTRTPLKSHRGDDPAPTPFRHPKGRDATSAPPVPRMRHAQHGAQQRQSRAWAAEPSAHAGAAPPPPSGRRLPTHCLIYTYTYASCTGVTPPVSLRRPLRLPPSRSPSPSPLPVALSLRPQPLASAPRVALCPPVVLTTRASSSAAHTTARVLPRGPALQTQACPLDAGLPSRRRPAL